MSSAMGAWSPADSGGALEVVQDQHMGCAVCIRKLCSVRQLRVKASWHYLFVLKRLAVLLLGHIVDFAEDRRHSLFCILHSMSYSHQVKSLIIRSCTCMTVKMHRVFSWISNPLHADYYEVETG